MSGETFDVLGIGNAIVDVLAHTDDRFLGNHGLRKGTMTLIDEARAEAIYSDMPAGVEISGGSAANTVVGVASLGGSAAYIGKVFDDQLGRIFRHDIRAAGVAYRTEAATAGPATARCMVLVGDDAERTMGTFLGASATLSPDDVDPEWVAAARVTYLEGYLWDPPDAKAAFRRAAELAHGAGREVALSLSDPFCVDRHRDSFLELVDHHVDILFANEEELMSLFQANSFEDALDRLRGRCRRAGITRGAAGSVALDGDQAIAVPVHPVEKVVDTTGAGDLYAAGFLFGHTRGLPADECGRLGGLAAAEIIGHMGARPESELRDWIAARKA